MSYAPSRAEEKHLTFGEFYLAEFDRVMNSSFAFCRDREAALDATQEAFARAYARWSRLSKQQWAGAWVTTTAINHLKRTLLRAKRSASTGTSRAVEASDGTRLDLLDALQRLPLRQRHAVVLFYIGDYPIDAVAETMGVSPGTIKAHLARARDSLRTTLEDQDA